MKQKIIPIIIVILTVLTALIAPRIGSLVANQINMQSIDPDGVFAWLYVHHIVQALIVLLIIAVVSRKTEIRFGFTLGNQAVGIAYVKKFTLYFLIYVTITMIVITFIFNAFNPLNFPLNARNVLGYLSFQLLQSGPSEEIIFRAFIMAITGYFFKTRILNNRFSVSNIIAAIVFVVAHIGFQFSPFSFSYDPVQLVYAFVLGMIYGDCYEKTKSVYYPMLLHSISNVISITAVVIVQVLTMT